MEHSQPFSPRAILDAVVVFALSAVFAVLATILLAVVADANNWCCVQSWGLAHGTGVVVLLLFGLLGFHIISFAAARFGSRAPRPLYGWLPHLAYLLAALGSQSVIGPSDMFMWLGLLASLAAVAARVRGYSIQPFGLVIVALVVSVLGAATWI